MSWIFAIVNGRLAEIFFDEKIDTQKKKKYIRMFGHCYVEKKKYKTKREQSWIKKDTKNMRLTFRNGMYRLHKNASERAKKLIITTKKLSRYAFPVTE